MEARPTAGGHQGLGVGRASHRTPGRSRCNWSPPILYEPGAGARAGVAGGPDPGGDGAERHGGVRWARPAARRRDAHALFSAVPELLVNVVKHALHAQVSVSRDDRHVRISVLDDGVGCEREVGPNGGAQSSGFGLFNIRERLGHLGGRLDMDSDAGLGCRVTPTVPLPAAAEALARPDAARRAEPAVAVGRSGWMIVRICQRTITRSSWRACARCWRDTTISRSWARRDGRTAVEMCDQLSPHVVIMGHLDAPPERHRGHAKDHRRRRGREGRRPVDALHPPVHDRGRKAGAAGTCWKESAVAELIPRDPDGDVPRAYLEPARDGRRAGRLRPSCRPAAASRSLTVREREVLQLVAEGGRPRRSPPGSTSASKPLKRTARR